MPGKLSAHVLGFMVVKARRVVTCISTLSIAILAQAIGTAVVSVQVVEIDPTVSCLTNEELIDRLQSEGVVKIIRSNSDVSQPAFELFTPAFPVRFLPIVEPALFRVKQKYPHSQIMTELVKRGVAALPELLRHLTDSRPTQIVRHWNGEPFFSFGDHYDYRYSDPGKQPKNVNTVSLEGESELSALNSSYTYSVGDLCLRVVGQIVNRRETPPSNIAYALRQTVVRSPTRYPALAEAAPADWAGLTAKEHEQSLRFDALEFNEKGREGYHARGALQRLLFYYPDSGREVAESLLRRELIARGTKQPLAIGQVTCGDQCRLVDEELTAFQWDGLDQLIFEVFEKAMSLPGANSMLSIACAKRLAGRGYDGALTGSMMERVARNETELTFSTVQPARRKFLIEQNDAYRALLKTLAGGA